MISILLIYINLLNAQTLPLGYINHFETDFSGNILHKDLIFSPSADLKIVNGIAYLQQNPDSVPQFEPSAAMLIDNNIFGDFISELTLIDYSIAKDSSSGTFLIFGLRNKENYYLVQMNTTGAAFYKMYKGKVDKIAHDSAFVLPKGKSVKIRIERNILERSLTIKMQGKQVEFTDPNLVMGYFGIGANTSKVGIDKLIIWAPTSMDEPLKFF
jgi:hypothetical protein